LQLNGKNALIEKTAAEFGSLDTLVNNVAIIRCGGVSAEQKINTNPTKSAL
jgi:hypothetical protein